MKEVNEMVRIILLTLIAVAVVISPLILIEWGGE